MWDPSIPVDHWCTHVAVSLYPYATWPLFTRALESSLTFLFCPFQFAKNSIGYRSISPIMSLKFGICNASLILIAWSNNG
ncbi:hypothetical protein MRB53_011673 [Persea americana]|uniref:Uncharacterized protein n=1 Tax=Persea americana TaxID=3435 RepID=A0ACC2LV92_PERAE|nr:hypothetical protein MRB53_011673 [Persea americana]